MSFLRRLAPLMDLLFWLQDRVRGVNPDDDATAPCPDFGLPLPGGYGFFTADDGCRLGYRKWQPADGKVSQVLCCMHGVGGYGGHFYVIGERLLSEGVATYTLDLRGHGRSDGPRHQFADIGRVIRDLGEVHSFVLKEHPGSQAYFMGESFGSALVLEYALHRTAPLAGLILSGPEFEPTVPTPLLDVIRYLPHVLFNARANVVEASNREELCSRDQERIRVAKLDPLIGACWSVRTLWESYKLMGKAFRYGPYINLPVLLLQGGADLVTSPEASRAFFETLAAKDKEMHLFPEAYHGLFFDPETPNVLAVMSRWLARHRAAAGEPSEVLARATAPDKT